MRRVALIGFATFLAGVAVVAAGAYMASLPTRLKIAVGPPGSESARIVTAISHMLVRDQESLRLAVRPTQNPVESARALEAGQVDLAIVRADVAMPANAQTVAIWQRDAVILLVDPASSIELSDIAGKRIGVPRANAGSQLMLARILDHYGLPSPPDHLVMLDADDLQGSMERERIEVLMVMGPPAGERVRAAIAAATTVFGASPRFLPIAEADALAGRIPALEELEIPRGAFGGNPPRPPEAFETLATTHRLVARADLDENDVSELTRLLFKLRPALVAVSPSANFIEAPSTEKGARLPVHPGAAAFLDGEVLTFFDRYGDLFYLGAMVLSLFGSAIAAMLSRWSARGRARSEALIARLVEILRLARASDHVETLEELETELDALLAEALEASAGQAFDATRMGAFTLALDQARRAIASRRDHLSHRSFVT